MRIDKRNKIITFTPSDKNEWIIHIEHSKFNKYLNVKVTYTDKGFGLQCFSGDYDDERQQPMTVILGEVGEQQMTKETYVAVWKLLPQVTRRVTRKFRR